MLPKGGALMATLYFAQQVPDVRGQMLPRDMSYSTNYCSGIVVKYWGAIAPLASPVPPPLALLLC